MNLLDLLHGDRRLAAVFSPDNHLRTWLATEAALARAQGELGIIPTDAAAAIVRACEQPGLIDTAALWDSARNVGYPILGMVRQIDAHLDEPGHVHFGATTQDIMDTGLAIQLREAASIVDERLNALGDALARIVDEHRATVMAGRTHGLHAVPTTLGAKFAVFLHQVARHRDRLRTDAADACRVSLHGAGGTAAAYGPKLICRFISCSDFSSSFQLKYRGKKRCINESVTSEIPTILTCTSMFFQYKSGDKGRRFYFPYHRQVRLSECLQPCLP